VVVDTNLYDRDPVKGDNIAYKLQDHTNQEILNFHLIMVENFFKGSTAFIID